MATYEKAGPTIIAEVVDGYDYHVRIENVADGPLTARVRVVNNEGKLDTSVIGVAASSLTEQQKSDLVDILDILRADAMAAIGYTEQ